MKRRAKPIKGTAGHDLADDREVALMARLAQRADLADVRDRAIALLRRWPSHYPVPVRRLARDLHTKTETLHAAAELFPAYLIYTTDERGWQAKATITLHPHLDRRIPRSLPRGLVDRVLAAQKHPPKAMQAPLNPSD
jgi:hypothetical protein